MSAVFIFMMLFRCEEGDSMTFPTWSIVLCAIAGSIWLISSIGLYIVSAKRRKKYD